MHVKLQRKTEETQPTKLYISSPVYVPGLFIFEFLKSSCNNLIMNVSNIINSKKLYNLYDQIFDYFNLAIYDLESKIDTSFDYKNIKHKLETFADKHFKSALNEFNREISLLKDQIPDDFSKIEELSNEIRTYFNSFLEKKLFDYKKINDLKDNLKKNIDKINKIYS